MEYQEYMRVLTEQIHNKKARALVGEEIQNHIMEYRDNLMEEGFSQEEAICMAVEDMGDPVETGCEMNRIHRPRVPYIMMITAVVLCIVGIVMQSLVFSALDNSFIRQEYLTRTILYNGFGIAVITGLLFFNYTWMGRHPWILWAGYAGICVLAAWGVANRPTANQNSYAMAYHVMTLFPIVLSALIYRFRNQGIRGLLICMASVPVSMGWALLWFQCGLSGVMETFVISCVVLIVGVCMGVFGCKKTQGILVIVAGVGVVVLLLFVAIMGWIRVLPGYLTGRILNFFGSDAFHYTASLMELRVQNFTLWGHHTLPKPIATNMYAEYILNTIFYWFGIIPGLVILVATVGFSLWGCLIAGRQTNRMGRLLCISCSTTLLVRIISFLLINFGFGISYTTSVPFLTFGFWNSAFHGILVGLMFAVYRNDPVLPIGLTIQKRKKDLYENV